MLWLVRLFIMLFIFFCSQILLFLGVIFVALGLTGISSEWPEEWPTVPLSLQVQKVCKGII